jgi:[ribosomal protein S18]-alanine N-acetyltransferase
LSANPEPVVWFRTMRPEDLDCVASIEGRTYAFPWTLGNFRDSVLAGHDCVTCLSGEAIVGYFVLMIAGPESHLLNITIDRDEQRRGYGSALLDQVVRRARKAGSEQLLLEVRPSNGPAKRLYQRAGFRVVGVRKNYYPARAGREDALVMSLSL